MSYPNPYDFRIPPDSQWTFACMSNVNLLQRVTVTLRGQPAAVFAGEGVGVQLKTETGEPWYKGANRQAITASVLFQVSTDGVTYTDATVAQASTSEALVSIACQDSSQGSSMDTWMVCTFNDAFSQPD